MKNFLDSKNYLGYNVIAVLQMKPTDKRQLHILTVGQNTF